MMGEQSLLDLDAHLRAEQHKKQLIETVELLADWRNVEPPEIPPNANVEEIQAIKDAFFKDRNYTTKLKQNGSSAINRASNVPPPNQNPSQWHVNTPPPPKPDPRIVPPAVKDISGAFTNKMPHEIDKKPWWKFW